MNEQIEVINKLLELLETMEEGLIYIEEKLSERDPKNAIKMLMDTTDAFASIEVSLQPILPELPENSVQEKTDGLRSGLAIMISEYENNQGIKALECLQSNTMPAFNIWRAELEQVLRPYTLS